MEEGELQGDVPRSRSKWERSCRAVWLCGGRRRWQVLALPIPSFLSVQKRESGCQTSLNS